MWPTCWNTFWRGKALCTGNSAVCMQGGPTKRSHPGFTSLFTKNFGRTGRNRNLNSSRRVMKTKRLLSSGSAASAVRARWRMLLLSVLTLASLSSGCVVHEHHYEGRRYPGYYHRYPEHVHGPGCGHVLRGGVWITVP